MNLVEFQQLSKRTMPFSGEPANQVEFENMLGNYAMGLVGESLELMYITRNANRLEENGTEEEIDNAFDESMKEMGDILHYAVGLLACLGEIADESKMADSKKGYTYVAGDISEIAKKHIYHRHDLDKQLLIDKVYNVIYGIYACSSPYFFDDVMQMNIDKLKTRYPDKFNTADSIARVDAK